MSATTANGENLKSSLPTPILLFHTSSNIKQEPSTPTSMDKDLLHVAIQALKTFEFIDQNQYVGGAQALAMNNEISMPCSCTLNTAGVDSSTDISDNSEEACGEQCINRQLMIECKPSTCPCGEKCHNQRFQRGITAPIEMFMTEQGKGYGIRAKENIKPHTFIAEYTGEVLSKQAFKKRVKEFSANQHQHFYFMSLKQDEILDATLKGGIARFINHSCNPNCVLQKWVVGKRLKMGLFSCRPIAANAEVTFNYNFETYGEKAQVCLCGEDNCKGVIGLPPKRRSSQDDDILPDSPESDIDEDVDEIEEEHNDSPEARTIKSPGFEDAEKIADFVSKALQDSGKLKRDEKGVEKLLRTDNISCLRRFVQLHGLFIIKSWLREYKTNFGMIRKCLMLLEKLPITTRNTIDQSGIDENIKPLSEHRDTIVSTMTAKLLNDWSTLVSVFKIPRAPRDKPKTVDAPKEDVIEESLRPNNPYDFVSKRFKHEEPRRNSSSNDRWLPRDYNRNRTSDRPERSQSSEAKEERGKEFLPINWMIANDPNGTPYYYNIKTNETSWEKPNTDPVSQDTQSVFSSTTSLATIEISQSKLDEVVERAKLQALEAEKEAELAAETRRLRKIKEKERLKKQQLKEKELLKRTSASSAVLTESPSRSKVSLVSTGSSDIKMDKNIREELSAVVIKNLSKYKTLMDSEQFKRHARKITHSIVEKESRDKTIVSVDDEIKKKIRKFVDAYWEKLQQRGNNSGEPTPATDTP